MIQLNDNDKYFKIKDEDLIELNKCYSFKSAEKIYLISPKTNRVAVKLNYNPFTKEKEPYCNASWLLDEFKLCNLQTAKRIFKEYPELVEYYKQARDWEDKQKAAFLRWSKMWSLGTETRQMIEDDNA